MISAAVTLDARAALPEAVLAGAGCLLLLMEAFLPATRRAFGAISILAAGGYMVLLERIPAARAFGGTLDGSIFAHVFGLFLGLAAVLTLLVARPYLERAVQGGLVASDGEFYPLLLWGAVGLSLMARGLDLLVIFLGLETFSLCFYILAAYFKRSEASSEAGLKYFLTGAFASSFTLFGIAFVFGKTGTTAIAGFADARVAADPLLLAGLVFLMSGFAFKVALAPFHAWAPDVYAGMPTPAVAFLSVAPKGAALVVLFRVLGGVFDGLPSSRLRAGLAAVAVLSMVIGNLVALAQRDIKRLLAYSGIAHMGYVAITLAVFGRDAFAAALVYLFAYALTNVGAFAAVAALYRDESKAHPVGLLAGMGTRAPLAAGVLALCMISLGGIPATAGFIGKFFVFKSAIEKDLLWLALVGVINSLVSLGYYLRVVYVLYMREPVEPEGPPPLAPESRLALLLCGLGVLAVGLFPGRLWQIAQAASRAVPHLGP
ncbi:MAG TPA: NADH-quinone oxidoreductase subunit N [Thermoanaerobaculia bacterium]|nr:NADH-quinone oxidoreductase subunit N [Thermoanaerobaculia bacterium]